MRVLAIDTATRQTAVALVGDGAPRELSILSGPGENAVAMIDQLLVDAGIERSELTAVAVGVGPGPYTSTRIGVMIATGIAHVLGIPVIGICTLDAIAAQTNPGEAFGVATDARRREVYWATYDAHGNRTDGPAVTKPGALLESLPDLKWAGDGFERYPDLDVQKIEPVLPSAAAIGELAAAAIERGESAPAATLALAAHTSDGSGVIPADQRLFPPYPLYLRRPDAVEPKAAVNG